MAASDLKGTLAASYKIHSAVSGCLDGFGGVLSLCSSWRSVVFPFRCWLCALNRFGRYRRCLNALWTVKTEAINR